METKYGRRLLDTEKIPMVHLDEYREPCQRCGIICIVSPIYEMKRKEEYWNIKFLCSRCVPGWDLVSISELSSL